LRKENIRQPASAWNVSTRSIFIGKSRQIASLRSQ
jgi:hypothetical protein